MTLTQTRSAFQAFLSAILLVFTVSACSKADAPIDTGEFDKASLQAALDEYDRYFEARDFETLLAIGMPDKLIVEFAKLDGDNDPDLDQYRAMIAQQFDSVFDNVEITKYETGIAKAKIRTTPTGRPYAFVPTTIELVTNGTKVRVESDMIAIVEDGQWYFLNPSDPSSIATIKKAFPDLDSLKIEPQKTQVVSQ